MVKSTQADLTLWSDEPATTDLLSFDAIAETVVTFYRRSRDVVK